MRLVEFEIVPLIDWKRDKIVFVNPDQVVALYKPLPEAIEKEGVYTIVTLVNNEIIMVKGEMDVVARQLTRNTK